MEKQDEKEEGRRRRLLRLHISHDDEVEKRLREYISNKHTSFDAAHKKIEEPKKKKKKKKKKK